MRRKNLSGPKFEVLENPFSGVPLHQRRVIMSQLRTSGNQKVNDAIVTIESIFAKNDPLQLLSMLASYELTVAAGDSGEFNRGKEQISQSYVEFCQGIALKSTYVPQNTMPAGPDVYQKLRDSIIQIKNSLPYMDFDENMLDLDEREIAIKTVQKKVRDHSFLIRNWGHFDQVEKITSELFGPLNPMLAQTVGFNVDETISVFNGMIRIFESSVTSHRKMLAELMQKNSNEEIVYKYYSHIGEGKERALKFIKEVQVKKLPKMHLMAMIMSHQDIFLKNIFIYTPSQLSRVVGVGEDKVEKILNFLSMKLGDLEDLDASTLFLENPIRYKVVIKIADKKYFCALPHVFFSYIFPTLDRLIEFSEIKSLPDRRSDFLENKVEEIVKTRFPKSNTIRNVTWRHADRTYETDLITFIDSYAIIFEAKSGKITPSALRGGTARIRKHLEEILIAPNIQSRRLAEKLYAILSGGSDLELERQLPEQFRKVKKIIRVSVSLEHFSVIQSHLWSLKTTGWLPQDFKPCPSISIGDFESIFEILEHPIQVIHYLERRTDLEVEIHYLGDEMDLLGLYLDTLFDLKVPPDANNILNIYGMSKRIDDYFNFRKLGSNAIRPKANISEYWISVLQQLESRQVERWTELGSLLLSISPKDQEEMLQLVKNKKKYVHKNWRNDDHENIFVYTPPPPSEVALAFFLFKNENMGRRHEFLNAALEHGLTAGGGRIRKCIAIGINIDKNDMAYHLIVLGE